MENNNENNGFQYTYSAKEQTELKRIRDKYTAPTEVEDKMARLRRLDASVTNSQSFSLAHPLPPPPQGGCRRSWWQFKIPLRKQEKEQTPDWVSVFFCVITHSLIQ